jgi:thiol-disulfide isomerase/thioredoxin
LFLLFLTGSVFGQHAIAVNGYWENADRKKVELLFLEDAVIFRSTTLTSEIDSLTGHFSFTVDSDHPTKLQLLDQFILALPGDSIQISIDKNEKGIPTLKFTSRIEKEESFFSSLRKSIKPFAAWDFSFENAFATEDYKKQALTHYNAVINFLETHSLAYSTSASTLIKELVTIDYYSDLIYPVSSRKISKEQLPSDYFRDLDISLFNKSDLLGFREYILLLYKFNNYYYGTQPPKDKMYDPLNVINSVTLAKTNFEGEAKANLMLFIYGSLVERGTKDNAPQVEGLLKDVSTLFNDNPVRLKQISDMKRQFNLLGRPIPDSILSQQLKSEQGGTVLLSDAISKQKLIYIDLWASWCGPCITEMPQEKKLISEFKDKEVEFIFISLDKTERPWQKAMQKINIGNNHYRMPEGFSSVLTKYLDIQSIPRYIVIDKSGSLLSYDAPRPTEILKDKSKLFSLIK